jgi:hypothetical protein
MEHIVVSYAVAVSRVSSALCRPSTKGRDSAVYEACGRVLSVAFNVELAKVIADLKRRPLDDA